jgi:hypothetical protein
VGARSLIWHGSRDRFRISHKQLDDPPSHYHVYVIELAGSDGKRTSSPTVYVGKTSRITHRRGSRITDAGFGQRGACVAFALAALAPVRRLESALDA